MIRGSQGFHCLFDLPKCVDCAIISSNVRLFVLNVGSWLSLLSLLNLKTHISSLYCSTVVLQYHTIQYNTIHYITIQYNKIKYNKIQYNTINYNTIQYNTIHYNTIQYNAIKYITLQYNTIQYNTTQYNTIQYNTTQHNTIQCLFSNNVNTAFRKFSSKASI